MNGAPWKKSILKTTVSLALISFVVNPALAADSPAVQDARQNLASGQYQDAMRITTQALSNRTTDPGDRYQLLMIRGEAFIQLGQRPGAATTFDLAAKNAPDAAGAAIARANALIARASPSGKYIPKAPGQQPIDIARMDSRKQAFEALREDQRTAIQPRLQAALAGTSLTPMLGVLPAMMDIADLESAATGTLEKTGPDLIKLGARARDLMNSELRRISYEVNSLEAASNSTDMQSRRGFTSPERDSLSNSAEYVGQIEQTARNARQHARDLGFDGAAWEPIIADCADVVDRIHGMLSVNP